MHNLSNAFKAVMVQCVEVLQCLNNLLPYLSPTPLA